MAVSGNQLTRIGASISAVAIKLTIAAKTEVVAPPSIAWISFALQQRAITFALQVRAIRLWLS